MQNLMAFPQYFFVIRWAGEEYDDPFGESFPSDADARNYAHRVIRELKAAGDFDEPDLKMIIVKNELGKTVFTIPFAEALN
jgi:hypothetical protein